MILSIDTSDNKKAIIELDGERFEVRSGLGAGQKVLEAVERILDKKGLKLSDLTEIKVNTGPGSFTGLKVGVTIANILGYLLKIPVNGKIITKRSFLLPNY